MGLSGMFLVCIMGPTGAGKSASALALAKEFPVCVVNADSRQLYRDFPIITAQPTAEEQSVCPHLLYGFLPSEQKLGAGEYARDAGALVRDISQNNRLPLLVGGTGLYFRALLQGIAPIPQVPGHIHAYWQQRCASEGAPALHAMLCELDPDYAARIHPNDRQRVTRALEVIAATERPFSWWHKQTSPPPQFGACKIGISLSLPELEPLLDRRIEAMLEAGALEEARAAMERCPDPSAPGWTGIGCAELHRYLNGDISFSQCRELWRKNTRAYAKRQLTWFRADKDIHWFPPPAHGRRAAPCARVP
ncbi:tRNA (adenosine(37)-N6)-dimethylallyltransferase MiaA [Desulfovibrio sp. OttesenSCG-928-A18]|nr:tRNA (adenosine(37)-N6)-dimethylallyltransferase MiaA [Desulfovibrio sp. OttesenSCG-928-A18]